MKFEMESSTQYLVMRVALSGHKALAVLIELAVSHPLRSHHIGQLAHNPEGVPVLHHTEVAVHRGYEPVQDQWRH